MLSLRNRKIQGSVGKEVGRIFGEEAEDGVKFLVLGWS